MIIKLLSIATIVAVTVSGTGCASASAKLESKAGYRKAQVDAIRVQREADVVAQQALSAERVAMWNALSEAVKHNPESASNLAIVAAVASSRSDSGTVTTGSVTTLTPEREVLPIDYVKALAGPLLTSATAVGISAITNETTRASINANRSVRIAEVGVDAATIGAINNAIDELDDDELSNSTSTANTATDVVDVVDVVDTTDVTSTTDATTTDTTTTDGTTTDTTDATTFTTVADDTNATTNTDESYYNDTECAAGQELVQTNWGTQCQ
jgi:Asp-tRNA(Asn)/Glu-tRNA(Gln) amidotransferase C subunit